MQCQKVSCGGSLQHEARSSVMNQVEKLAAAKGASLPVSDQQGHNLGHMDQPDNPLTPVYDLMNEDGVTDVRLRAAVDYLFEVLTFRPPNQLESDNYLAIVRETIEKLGKKDGVVLGLSSLFLDRDALFRPELAEDGKPDQHGRVLLQDWELGMAVNHSLRFIRPDERLRNAITNGRIRTRADVKREVGRMLANDSIRTPRILRFFREYLRLRPWRLHLQRFKITGGYRGE